MLPNARERKTLAEYLDDFYGICLLGPGCRCIRGPWKGVACENWRPTGATTWEELQAKCRALFSARPSS
jgi:hypothetical protein